MFGRQLKSKTHLKGLTCLLCASKARLATKEDPINEGMNPDDFAASET